MDIVLSRKALQFLDMIIRQPHLLPFPDMETPIKPYAASDSTGAEQMIALQKWLETKVLKKVVIQELDIEKELPEVAKYVIPVGLEEFKVGLAKTYISRVQEVMKHYVEIGRMTLICSMYTELQYALKGEKLDFDDPTVESESETE